MKDVQCKAGCSWKEGVVLYVIFTAGSVLLHFSDEGTEGMGIKYAD